MARAATIRPRLRVDCGADQWVRETDTVVVEHEHARVDRRLEPRARARTQSCLQHVERRRRDSSNREQSVPRVRRNGVEALAERRRDAIGQWKLESAGGYSSLLGDPGELQRKERIAARYHVNSSENGPRKRVAEVRGYDPVQRTEAERADRNALNASVAPFVGSK